MDRLEPQIPSNETNGLEPALSLAQQYAAAGMGLKTLRDYTYVEIGTATWAVYRNRWRVGGFHRSEAEAIAAIVADEAVQRAAKHGIGPTIEQETPMSAGTQWDAETQARHDRMAAEREAANARLREWLTARGYVRVTARIRKTHHPEEWQRGHVRVQLNAGGIIVLRDPGALDPQNAARLDFPTDVAAHRAIERFESAPAPAVEQPERLDTLQPVIVARARAAGLTAYRIAQLCHDRPGEDAVKRYLDGRASLNSAYVSAIMRALGWDGKIGWE